MKFVSGFEGDLEGTVAEKRIDDMIANEGKIMPYKPRIGTGLKDYSKFFTKEQILFYYKTNEELLHTFGYVHESGVEVDNNTTFFDYKQEGISVTARSKQRINEYKNLNEKAFKIRA
jgi:hypothetical protein